jgi:hypothetical protein
MKVKFNKIETKDKRIISSLTLNKEYEVLGIECDDFRI